jgi:hypothetical protein
MADIADYSSTFENSFFKAACNDVLRIVSIISLDSTHVTKPAADKPWTKTWREKAVFISRFFYLVFFKGFTPVVFDYMPFKLWQIISLAIYFYRLFILPFYLRLTGFGKYANWTNIGHKQPAPDSPDGKCYKSGSLLKEAPLSETNFGDPLYETFISKV